MVRIQVHSTPPSATVAADGTFLGKTPLDTYVKREKVTEIKVFKASFKPYLHTLKTAQGNQIFLDIDLKTNDE